MSNDIGVVEKAVLNMMGKIASNINSVYGYPKYVVGDPCHPQKILYELYWAEYSIPPSFAISKRLEFVIYDEHRMFELSKEKSDLVVELSVVGYLHHQKDLTLTFKNLSLEEPFCVTTMIYSTGIKDETRNTIGCKFINCVFENPDFNVGVSVDGIELEDCIKGKPFTY